MKKTLVIIFLLCNVITYSQIYLGGIDLGASYTDYNDKDTLTLNPSFSPVLGFSIYKNLKPKFYGGVSAIFTQRNGVSVSPSLKYKTLFIDWRLDLKYKFTSKFFLMGGVSVQQKLNGKVIRSQSKLSLDGIVNNQMNPFLGLSLDVGKYSLNARYYIPRVLYNTGSFNLVNQYRYAEVSVTFPIKPKLDESEQKKVNEDKAQAENDIKALKSGILLVALPQNKSVKDKELANLLADAFNKQYKFSRYFIVDENDIQQLINTGKIDVYEEYPFVAKQTIDLTNLTWYYASAGKTVLTDDKNNESYDVNGIFIYNKLQQQLKQPFPFYMPVVGNNVITGIKSLNAELEKYYYEVVFGM